MKFLALHLKNLFVRTAPTVLASLTLAATTIPTTAIATTVYYHGSECQPYYGNQASSFNNQSTGIRNVASNERHIICPIDKEGFTWNSTSDLNVYVSMYNTTSATLSPNTCFLWGMHTFGNNITYDYHVVPGWKGTTTYGFVLKVKTNKPVYALQCRLRPGSMLMSYHVY